MLNVYEIHRYAGDDFQYVVARTNKYAEEKIRKDVERMNAMLSDELKAQGIRYVFAIGSSTTDIINTKQTSKRERN
ncbi:MAG TPA: hypothetical protein VFY41_07870 [Nitrososphaeraceae archaeon]|nr:hypothetical protein [Nitrososphaeraceae archaeon]